MKNIIFIFSLPRSGSTLLQRMLMTHDKISSANEPWLLLPFLYPMLGEQKAYIEYGHEVSRDAINNLVNQLPNGKNDYYQEINTFTKNIYNKIGDENTIYFVDKTPRYYFIIPEIAKAFPEAKFIFLFRNPLSILTSICSTWRKGIYSLNPYNKTDLTKGFNKLTNGYELLKNKSIKINYENLTQNPKKEMQKICSYLEIDFDKKMIKNFADSNLNGQFLGDPNREKYKNLQTKSSDKWKRFLNTCWRKRKAKKYLKNISSELLELAGYDKKKLIQEVEENNIKFFKNFTNTFIFLKEVSKKIIMKIWERKNH